MALFAVTTAKGPNWRQDQGIRDQQGWEDHARFFDRLVEQGVVVLGGPIESHYQDEVGLLAVRAADESEVRSAFGADPWATSGVLRVKDVRTWTIWLDGRGSSS
jgi:uncharacterized protein YciI